MSAFKPIVAISSIIIILLALATAPGLAQGPTLFAEPTSPPAFVPGEILVRFKPYVGTQNAQKSLQSQGLQSLEVSSYNDVIRVKVEPNREQEVIAKLLARGDVEIAEPNYIAYALFTPNDPLFGSQWGLSKINMPAAWDITGGSAITVAIVDTGIDLDHPDFNCAVTGGWPKLMPGTSFIPGNNDGHDDNNHGTHVAGIVGACVNNAVGVAGVAPNARLMPVKMLDAGGFGTYENGANGIIYAVNQGAAIINLSWGGAGSSSVLSDAVKYADNHGVLVVAASGNNGPSIFYPAAYPQTMAVGATTSTDSRAYYSNYGAQLDIVAPGDSIYSTVISNTPTSIGYNYKSGTSMATPHVAGLAALLWSFDPSLTAAQVRDLIQNTADDLYPSDADSCGKAYYSYVGQPGWDPCFGYGRINARRALESASLQTTPAQLNLMIDDYSGPVSGNIQVATVNPQSITWTVVISPAASWLSLSSPLSGTVSLASSPAQVVLLATTTTLTYTDTPITATVIVTGTTSSGITLGPKVTLVQLTYVPKLNRYYLPIILKAVSSPWIVPLPP